MDSTKSYIGHIDLPEDDNSKFCNLNISQSNEVSIAFLTEKRLDQSMIIPVVNGNFEGMGEITLINCRLKRYSTTYSKYDKYEYYAELLIKGMIFKSPEELAPTKFAFTLENLHKWFFPNNLQMNLVTSEAYLQETYKFKIDLFSEMVITIGNQMAWSFTNDCSHKNEITWIRYRCILEGKGFTLDTVTRLSRLFQKLMLFITGKVFPIDAIHCESEAWNTLLPNGNKSVENIEIGSLKNNYSEHFFLAELVFSYKEIKDLFEALVKNWYSSVEKFEYLVDLLLTYYLFPGISRQSHFMNTVSAYEGLYKHLNNCKNELGEVLRETVDIIEVFYLSDSNDFIEDCRVSRNFFAHGKKNKNSDKIFNDFELLYASKCLSIIGKYWLLKEFGLNNDLLDEKLDQSAKSFRDLMMMNKRIAEKRVIF
jgi:hypothetical protein